MVVLFTHTPGSKRSGANLSASLSPIALVDELGLWQQLSKRVPGFLGMSV
jgi:hypothetical protein